MAVIFFPFATLVSIFYCMFYYTKPFYERQSTMLYINVSLLTNITICADKALHKEQS